MATYIKTEDSGRVSYENQPDAKQTMFKNETPITPDQVQSIVLAVLESMGITYNEETDIVTIDKILYTKNAFETENARPVVLTTEDPAHAAGLLATWQSSASLTGAFSSQTAGTGTWNITKQ